MSESKKKKSNIFYTIFGCLRTDFRSSSSRIIGFGRFSRFLDASCNALGPFGRRLGGISGPLRRVKERLGVFVKRPGKLLTRLGPLRSGFGGLLEALTFPQWRLMEGVFGGHPWAPRRSSPSGARQLDLSLILCSTSLDPWLILNRF